MSTFWRFCFSRFFVNFTKIRKLMILPAARGYFGYGGHESSDTSEFSPVPAKLAMASISPSGCPYISSPVASGAMALSVSRNCPARYPPGSLAGHYVFLIGQGVR
jgi:hypothetical protein